MKGQIRRVMESNKDNTRGDETIENKEEMMMTEMRRQSFVVAVVPQ